MNVLNTLIWTIIYSTLIYRKNVIYCTQSVSGLAGVKVTLKTPDPGGGQVTQSSTTGVSSQDSRPKTQPGKPTTPSTQPTSANSSDSSSSFTFADAGFASVDDDDDAEDEPTKQPKQEQQHNGSSQSPKSPPKPQTSGTSSRTQSRPTSHSPSGSPLTSVGSPSGHSSISTTPRIKDSPSKETSGPTVQQATKTPNQQPANKAGSKPAKPTSDAQSTTPKTSSSTTPPTKPASQPARTGSGSQATSRGGTQPVKPAESKPADQSGNQGSTDKPASRTTSKQSDGQGAKTGSGASASSPKPAGQQAGQGASTGKPASTSSGSSTITKSVTQTAGPSGGAQARPQPAGQPAITTNRQSGPPAKTQTPKAQTSTPKSTGDISKPVKLKGVEINLKQSYGTHEISDITKTHMTKEFKYSYTMMTKLVTYDANKGYGFSRVKTQSGSCCSKKDVKIWAAANESEYATTVVLEGKTSKKKTVTIKFANGSKKVFKKDSKEWTELTKTPLNTGTTATAGAPEKIVTYDGGFPDGWHDTDMAEKPKQQQQSVVTPKSQPAVPKSGFSAKVTVDSQGKSRQPENTSVKTGSSNPSSTDSSSTPRATPASESSPTSGTITTTATPKTTSDSSSTKVVVDNQVVDNGCGCTCKNFWCGLITCGIYNCCKHCKSKSKSKSKSGSSSRSQIELDVTVKVSCQNYICTKENDIYTYVGAFGIFRFNKVKEKNNDIWTAGSGESAEGVEYDSKNNKVKINLGKGNQKVFKKGSDEKWEEDKSQAGKGGSRVSNGTRGGSTAPITGGSQGSTPRTQGGTRTGSGATTPASQTARQPSAGTGRSTPASGSSRGTANASQIGSVAQRSG